MISPILTYHSVVWGAYTKSNLKSWENTQIEKSHLQFCKRYLEVSNKASNVACGAELGKFPLIIAINQKIINYSSYLLSKDNCSIVKQIFLMSQDLHHAGEKIYYYHFVGHCGALCGLKWRIFSPLNKPMKSENQTVVRYKQPIKIEKPLECSLRAIFLQR